MASKLIRYSKALWRETVKRLPYILAIGVVLAGFSFYQSWRKTAESVRAVKANSEKIDRNTAAVAKNTEELKKSVKDLKADNEQQTKILCRLILRGDLSLSSKESIQVEDICKEAIQRENAQAASPTTPKQTPGSTNKQQGSAPPPTNKTPQNEPPGVGPTPPSKPLVGCTDVMQVIGICL